MTYETSLKTQTTQTLLELKGEALADLRYFPKADRTSFNLQTIETINKILQARGN